MTHTRTIEQCPVCDDHIPKTEDQCESCGWTRSPTGGRTKLDETDETVTDGFKIPSKLRDEFNKLLRARGKNKSDVLRGFIKDWCEANKSIKREVTRLRKR